MIQPQQSQQPQPLQQQQQQQPQQPQQQQQLQPQQQPIQQPQHVVMSTVDAAGNTVQQVGTIIHNAQGQPQFIAVSSCGPTHVMVGTPSSVATQGGNAVATVLGTSGPRVVAVQQPVGQQFVATAGAPPEGEWLLCCFLNLKKHLLRSFFKILLDDPDLWPIIVEPCVYCHLAGFFR